MTLNISFYNYVSQLYIVLTTNVTGLCDVI